MECLSTINSLKINYFLKDEVKVNIISMVKWLRILKK